MNSFTLIVHEKNKATSQHCKKAASIFFHHSIFFHTFKDRGRIPGQLIDRDAVALETSDEQGVSQNATAQIKFRVLNLNNFRFLACDLTSGDYYSSVV